MDLPTIAGWGILGVTLCGHAALWASAVNRLHGWGLPRRLGHQLTAAMFLVFLTIPAVWLGWGLWTGLPPYPWQPWLMPCAPAAVYAGLCWLVGGLALWSWLRRRVLPRKPAALLAEVRLPLGPPPDGGHWTAFGGPIEWIARLPGNDVAALEFVQRTLALPRWPSALEGLTIAHLSDIHLCGHVTRDYFREIVRRVNDQAPDLVALTGDLLDSPQCLQWLPEVFGGLRSRLGAYYILGNHDQQFGVERLRPALAECGLIDLGGRWEQIDVDGQPLVLAGNEFPWFPAAEWAQAPPGLSRGGVPRIVLAHTPDRVGWASRHDVDLILAGHVHGGQIRFPVLGPLLSPSFHGVWYADGAVFQRGPTVLHVSRGVSGVVPARWNCPPEVVTLILRSAPRRGVGFQPARTAAQADQRP